MANGDEKKSGQPGAVKPDGRYVPLDPPKIEGKVDIGLPPKKDDDEEDK